MKNKRNAFLQRALLATLCSGVIAAVTINASDMIETHASSNSDEISLTGLQMRGTANGWYYYLVLLSDSYTGGTPSEAISDYANYLSGDKIRFYLSEDDTGKTLSDLTLQHVGQNQFGANGCFINYAEYDSSYGGHQVYKVTVEKGCRLPYEKDGTVGAYSVNANYTFINQSYGDESKKLSSFDWTMSAETVKTVSLDGVQLRGLHGGDLDTNSWYHYLAVSSPSFAGMSAVESSVEMGSYISTLNKIRLYKVGTDGELTSKTLAELGVNHSERNKWEGMTAIMFAFDEFKNGWDGLSVYKVEIEKDCVLVADNTSYTQKFLVDKDYVFYNSSFGKTSDDDKFGALVWTSSPTLGYVAEEKTISLSGIQLRGDANAADNSWYHYLVLKTETYRPLGTQDQLTESLKWSDLSGIKLYTKNANGELEEKGITPNHVGANIWGEAGAFIAFNEYKDGLDGTNVYKISIPAGTKIAAGLSGEKARVFVTDKEYVYYNSCFGDLNAKFGSFVWTSEPTIPYASNESTISLSGVQLRGLEGDDSYYHYLVLLSDSYEGAASNIDFGTNGLKWCDLSGIKLYTKKADGTLEAHSPTFTHQEMNKWGANGAFLAFNEYKDGLDGTNVYRIDVASGTKLMAGTGEKAKLFVVDKDYSFINKEYGKDSAEFGAYQWLDYVPEEMSFSISGVQLRGFSDNAWYQYLVLLSDDYKRYEVRDNSDMADTSNFLSADKIRLYLSDEDEGKTLAELGVNHVDQSFSNWSTGAYINYNDFEHYNGNTVYRVEIEKDCRVPVVKDGKIIILSTDKGYSFYNVGHGDESKTYGSFGWWTSPLPKTVESTGDITIRNITNQSDGVSRWIILYFNEKFVGTTDVTFYDTRKFSNILDSIYLYSGNDLSEDPIKLRDVFAGAITIGQFGSPDAIGFSVKNEENINGSNMYATVIKEGCEVPFVKDGVFSKRIVSQETVFLNENYGKTGEIPGETGSDSRTYENWAVNSAKSIFVDYRVVGVDKTFNRECLKIGTKIDASKFAVDGYQLSITDNRGYTYYGEIVLPDQNVEITLTYSKIPEEEPKPVEDKNQNNLGLIIGLSIGAGVIVVAGLSTFLFLHGRKKQKKIGE